jgi:anti-sigma factor RsiW
MDCEALREVLIEHVDGLLDAEGADAAREHLAVCEPCRDLREEVRRGFDALDHWTEEDLPAGAWQRLVDRLPGVRPPVGVAPVVASSSSAPRWKRLAGGAALPYLAGIATAAALVLVLYPTLTGTVPSGSDVSPAGRGRSDAVADTETRPNPFHTRMVVPGTAESGTSSPGVEGVSLREGERRLEFRDVRRGVGVQRRIQLPPEIDPTRVVPVVDERVEAVSGVR